MNRHNALIAMWKYPHVKYEEQIELILGDLQRPFVRTRLADGKEIEEEFRLFHRITTVRGDSTGVDDFPMEFMRDHSGLPMNDDSQVQFTMHTKNDMFTLLDAALFREIDGPDLLSFPVGDPLTAELEEQMEKLVREYVGQGEFLSPHAPEEPGIHDDACMMLALDCLGANRAPVGDILFL
jgi:hypothetical protein